MYDIDHDFVRYRYSDFLEAYNRNAFRLNIKEELFDVGEEENLEDDRKLFHKQGEAWIAENTWLTGEKNARRSVCYSTYKRTVRYAQEGDSWHLHYGRTHSTRWICTGISGGSNSRGNQ